MHKNPSKTLSRVMWLSRKLDMHKRFLEEKNCHLNYIKKLSFHCKKTVIISSEFAMINFKYFS